MSYDLLFQKANSCYQNGQLDEAYTLYRQLLDITPQNPDILNMLGLIASQKRLFDSATAYFYEAVRFSEKYAPYHFNLAVALAGAGKYVQAAEAYQNVVRLMPDLKEAYNNLGGVYEHLDENQKARDSYQFALKLDPAYLEAAVNLAVLEHNTNMLQNLFEQYPLSYLPAYYLALEAFHGGLTDQAKTYIEHALKYGSEIFEINILSAKIHLKNEEKESAKIYFQRAFEQNPYSVEALVNLGVLENQEDYFKKALSLEPQNFEAHANYAACLYNQDRALEALEEYHQAILLNPDSAEVSHNLALVLKDLGEYEQALDLFMNAFLHHPAETSYSLSIFETLVLLHRTEPEKASKIAKNWLHTAPENSFAKHISASFENKTFAFKPAYMKQIFDAFAPTYEQTMSNLKYDAAGFIQNLPLKLSGQILDLGCGTGLAAQYLARDNTIWTGVDVSAKMLQEAQNKHIYHELVCDDILSFLEKNTNSYDYILMLDVAEYIDDLKSVFEKTTPSTLIFTIEKADETVKEKQLSNDGRYKHNPNHISKLLEQSGYKNICSYDFDLRYEQQKPVKAVLFVAES